MLRDFLQYRLEASNRIASQTGIKQQLQGLLQFIISSFAALHALFIGNVCLCQINGHSSNVAMPIFIEGFPETSLPQGLLSENLKRVCQSSAVPTVQLLSLTPGFVRQLPPIITDFR